jgi:hypothetical protein
MWDNTGGNELNESLSDAALSLDSNATHDRDTPGSYSSAQELRSLWTAAGLRAIEVKNIAFPCGFDSFDDFWQPLTEGQGLWGAYLRGISEDHRTALRERLRRDLFGNRADGPFTLNAKAWAVRGVAP